MNEIMLARKLMQVISINDSGSAGILGQRRNGADRSPANARPARGPRPFPPLATNIGTRARWRVSSHAREAIAGGRAASARPGAGRLSRSSVSSGHQTRPRPPPCQLVDAEKSGNVDGVAHQTPTQERQRVHIALRQPGQRPGPEEQPYAKVGNHPERQRPRPRRNGNAVGARAPVQQAASDEGADEKAQIHRDHHAGVVETQVQVAKEQRRKRHEVEPATLQIRAGEQRQRPDRGDIRRVRQ